MSSLSGLKDSLSHFNGVLPEILWNTPSHKEAFGFTDTMNSPFPLFTRAITYKQEHVQIQCFESHLQI